MSSELPRRNNDHAAAQQRFLSLFLRSEREIFRYVAALVPNVADAEDIVQQTALALWEKFDAYDPAQPFTPWACRFALNKARQWIERQQRWRALLDGDLAEELVRRRPTETVGGLPGAPSRGTAITSRGLLLSPPGDRSARERNRPHGNRSLQGVAANSAFSIRLYGERR
jgi:RNA polymerase sigma factor (sigma-70 family)